MKSQCSQMNHSTMHPIQICAVYVGWLEGICFMMGLKLVAATQIVGLSLLSTKSCFCGQDTLQCVNRTQVYTEL